MHLNKKYICSQLIELKEREIKIKSAILAIKTWSLCWYFIDTSEQCGRNQEVILRCNFK